MYITITLVALVFSRERQAPLLAVIVPVAPKARLFDEVYILVFSRERQAPLLAVTVAKRTFSMRYIY